MLPSLSKPTSVVHRVKDTSEKVRETLELMGMDFSEFVKHRAQ